WDILLRRMDRGRVTPIVGWDATAGILPPQQEIADKWAAEYDYSIDDSGDLTKVAQYMAVTRDRMLPREEIAAVAAQAALGDGGDIYTALASLPVSVYLTTNFDDLLTQALRNAGKQPTIEVCPWRNPPADPTILPPGVTADPTPDTPVVYHLHGHPSDEASLVLTEDDYFDYVVSVSRNRNVIRPRILEALSGTSLVMVGYRLEDWMFRVLVRGLIAATEAGARGFSVAVQLGDGEPEDHEFIGDFIRALFKASDQNKLSVYWGSPAQFADDLRRRLEARSP
ncbi:MAG: SIR2 family protein, partial [Acidimicrobiia bacterium]|nr:SIR2 family protein [Acidimicrobiia bacterium]